MEKKAHTSTRLNEIMIEQNLKQVDILKKSIPYCKEYNVRLERNDLSQYVSGKTEPRLKKLMVLAETLNVNPAWLIGFDVPKKNINKFTKDDDKTDLQYLEKILKNKGILENNEELTEKDFEKLMDFTKAVKPLIMKNEDK